MTTAELAREIKFERATGLVGACWRMGSGSTSASPPSPRC